MGISAGMAIPSCFAPEHYFITRIRSGLIGIMKMPTHFQQTQMNVPAAFHMRLFPSRF